MKEYKAKNEIYRIKFNNGRRIWVMPDESITFGSNYIIVTDKQGISTAFPVSNIIGISYGHSLKETSGKDII